VDTPALNYEPLDFRSEAAALSAELLKQHRIRPDVADLASVDLSLCVPAAGDPVAKRKHVSLLILITLIIPFVLLGLGLLGMFLADRAPIRLPVNPRFVLAGGIVLGCLGFIGILSAVAIQGAILRGQLQMTGTDTVRFQPTVMLANIGVENPATRTTVKLLIEDRGNLFCDASRRLIVIEGMFYRYVVRLVPGLVFTVDPELVVPEERLYLRVEDTVAVTESGIENLTADAPMEMDEIESIMDRQR
jgi:hypothetical protein